MAGVFSLHTFVSAEGAQLIEVLPLWRSSPRTENATDAGRTDQTMSDRRALGGGAGAGYRRNRRLFGLAMIGGREYGSTVHTDDTTNTTRFYPRSWTVNRALSGLC